MPIVSDRIQITTPIRLDLKPVLEFANLTETREIAAYTILQLFEELRISYEHLSVNDSGTTLTIE